MNTILVPVDFSKASRDAAKYGAVICAVFNAELLLLHVYATPATVGEVPSILMAGSAQLQSDCEETIEKEATCLREQFEVPVRTKVKPGLVPDIISQVSEHTHAALVVMGMKWGEGRPGGATTTTTIRKTKIPVLLVPEDQHFVPLKTITLAADFREAINPDCYDLLIKMVRQFKAALRVVHITRPDEVPVAAGLPEKVQLDKALDELPLSFYDVKDSNVEKGIAAFLTRHPSELLVMVAHRHNLLERLFGRIHTTAMCHRLVLPLLVLKDR